MEEKIFCVESLEFKNRVKKDYIIKMLVFLLFSLIVLFSLKNNDFGIIEVILVLYILLVILVTTLMKSIDYIYEVRIDSEKIRIFGEKFNQNWNVNLELRKVNIKIIERRTKSGSIVGYLIELRVKNKKFRINKLFNWNNFTLMNYLQHLKN